MTIMREVNGEKMAFELTEQEMTEAYYIKKREFMREDVLTVIEEEELGITLDDEQMEEVLTRYEDTEGDLNWRDIVYDAIDWCGFLEEEEE